MEIVKFTWNSPTRCKYSILFFESLPPVSSGEAVMLKFENFKQTQSNRVSIWKAAKKLKIGIRVSVRGNMIMVARIN